MSKVQTDNSNYNIKIKLRNENLPDKNNINVLDCFSGEGKLWNKIKILNPNKIINVTRIDKKKDLPGIYLCGDNIKFLKKINLSKYDVIDFDAYGFPEKQINACYKNINIGTTLFITIIQSIYGNIPSSMIKESGINISMFKKIKSLFNVNKADEIIYNYLLRRGLKNVIIYRIGRKKYIYGKKEWGGV